MTHVDDGVLMAFLDGELSPGGRADTAEHVLACAACRARLESLKAADGVLDGALALIAERAPVEQAHARFRQVSGGRRAIAVSGEFGRTFIRAAGLVLLLVAGASAAVPGSPVRNWIRTTLVSKETAARRSPDTTTGVSILPDNGRVDITISDAAAGTHLRVRSVDDARASVMVPEAKRLPQFHTSPGRIGVMGVAGTVQIDVPRAATAVRVSVNGDAYVEGGSGVLRAVVTAETRDGELMFTLH